MRDVEPLTLACWSDGVVLTLGGTQGSPFDQRGQVSLHFSSPSGERIIRSIVSSPDGRLAVFPDEGKPYNVRKKISWFLCSTLPRRILSSIPESYAINTGLPVKLPSSIADVLFRGSPLESLAAEIRSATSRDRTNFVKTSVIAELKALCVGSRTNPGGRTLYNFPVQGSSLYVTHEWGVVVNDYNRGSSATPGRALRAAGFCWPAQEAEWTVLNQDAGELLVDVEVPLLLDEVPDFWLGRS